MEKVFENIFGSVDQEMLNKFIDIQRRSSKDKQTVIFFETTGGYSAIGRQIVEIINNIPNCVLSAGAEVSSCGFYIFFHAKCEKRIGDICNGMTHVGDFSTYTNHVRIKNLAGDTHATMKNIKRSTREEARFYRKYLGMGKKFVNWYKKDYNVYFDAKKMQKMIDFQKKSGFFD